MIMSDETQHGRQEVNKKGSHNLRGHFTHAETLTAVVSFASITMEELIISLFGAITPAFGTRNYSAHFRRTFP